MKKSCSSKSGWKAEIEIPSEYVAPLLLCAALTELSVEEIVEIVFKFYMTRSEDNA